MLDNFRETAITWDKANRKVYEPLRVSAGDNKGRKLSIQVVNGGVVENLSGASLSLFWETRDKMHKGLDVFTAVDATKGEFEIYYTTGMLSNEGVLNANLVLVDTSGRVVSEPFTITVFKGIDDDAIQSSDSFTALTEALIDVSNLEQNYAPRLNDLTAQLQQTEQSLSSQLADNAKKMNKELISAKNSSPMVTIIDDDCATQVLSSWSTLLSTKQFKLDLAVITDFAGKPGYLSWEQLEDLKASYDIDIINHSHTHVFHANLTEDELINEFEKSTSILRKKGHTSDVYVYPGGSQNYLIRQTARKYTRGAFLDKGGRNGTPLHTYNIRRMMMMDNNNMADVATMKNEIDLAISRNSWLVFMSHSQFGGFDIDKVGEIIDYINQKVDEGLIEWAHASEGLDRRGNIIDIGDSERQYEGLNKDYTIVDSDGITHSNVAKPFRLLGNSVDFNTPLSEYPESTISLALIYDAAITAPLFPLGRGGLLETLYYDLGVFNYQRYKPYNSDRLYQRTWNTGTKMWGAFREVGGEGGIKPKPDALFATPITEFDNNTLTRTTITTPKAGDFPTGSGGSLWTSRYENDTFSYQTFKPYHTHDIYTRQWKGSEWSAFDSVGKISASTYVTVNVTVEAGKVVDFTTSAKLPKVNYNAVVKPVSGLESGIMYCLTGNTPNTDIVIRLFNTSNADVTVNRQFLVNFIRN